MQDDTQSLFSDSATLYEVPTVRYDPDAAESQVENEKVEFLPDSQAFCKIYATYESAPPNPKRYVRAGLPAKYQRRQAGEGTVQGGGKIKKLFKKAPGIQRRLELQAS